MADTIIVIPCFNEASRLDVDAFKSYVAGNGDVRFLLVDDGSTDATASVLAALATSDANAFGVCTLEHNAGKAEAVRTGIAGALLEKPRYVGYWDAEGTVKTRVFHAKRALKACLAQIMESAS